MCPQITGANWHNSRILVSQLNPSSNGYQPGGKKPKNLLIDQFNQYRLSPISKQTCTNEFYSTQLQSRDRSTTS